jgi:hypothetical protein
MPIILGKVKKSCYCFPVAFGAGKSFAMTRTSKFRFILRAGWGRVTLPGRFRNQLKNLFLYPICTLFSPVHAQPIEIMHCMHDMHKRNMKSKGFVFCVISICYSGLSPREGLNGVQGVGGSNPLAPTKLTPFLRCHQRFYYMS